jgi:hypothetical protein
MELSASCLHHTFFSERYDGCSKCPFDSGLTVKPTPPETISLSKIRNTGMAEAMFVFNMGTNLVNPFCSFRKKVKLSNLFSSLAATFFFQKEMFQILKQMIFSNRIYIIE